MIFYLDGIISDSGLTGLNKSPNLNKIDFESSANVFSDCCYLHK